MGIKKKVLSSPGLESYAKDKTSVVPPPLIILNKKF